MFLAQFLLCPLTVVQLLFTNLLSADGHSMSAGIPSSALHIQNTLYRRVIIVVTLKCNGGMTLYVKISAVFEFELLALITTSNLQDGQQYTVIPLLINNTFSRNKASPINSLFKQLNRLFFV